MAGYGSDNGFQAFLTDNGLVLPVGVPSPAALRQRGSVHVDAHDFPGVPTGGFAQERAWPRTGATADNQTIPDNIIPVKIEEAAYAGAYFEALNPGALTTRSSVDQRIKRERVEGVTDIEYFGTADGAAEATVTVPMVEDLLAPFVLGDEPTVAIGLFALG